MSRHQARVAVRPDFRRMLLTGVAVAVVSLGWASVALAQNAAGSSSQDAAGTPSQIVAAVTSPSVFVAPTVTAAGETRGTPGTAPVGPVMSSSAVSFVPSQSREALTLDERIQDNRIGLGRNLAFVIVGIAAMVISSDVDDAPGDLLVIGGAGMTLYGLYHILR